MESQRRQLMNAKLINNESKFTISLPTPGALLEMIPSPAAIWENPRSLFTLNKGAQLLIGFSETDLRHDKLLWSKRVYRGDMLAFADRQKKMERRVPEIVCDYRIFAKEADTPIWIREILRPLSDSTQHPKWIGTYCNISDLKQTQSKQGQEIIRGESREAIGSLFHEIKNRLHLVSMELELTALEAGTPALDCKKMADALHDVNHSIKVLHDQLVSEEPDRSPHNP
jgi:hypothetical protein